MTVIGNIINKLLFADKIDPAVNTMINFKKLKYIPVIIQALETIDHKIKKCIKKYGGIIEHEFPFINACYALIPPTCIKPLEALYQTAYISLNHPIIAHLNDIRNMTGISTAHNLHYTGNRVTVALLDTGTYPHPDLIRTRNRIVRFVDLVNNIEYPYDDSGHGTFTAGIIAGNGSMSEGRYTGIAPETNIVSIKVLNQANRGRVSTVLSGLEWIYNNHKKYSIKVVCLPLGGTGHIPWSNDPLSIATQVLWDTGLSVCASSGNDGPNPASISSPGINPNIITVGAAQTYGSNIHPQNPVCAFSSVGPAMDGSNGIDMVAPGSNITSLNSDTLFIPKSMSAYKRAKLECHYSKASGSSVACAAVSGMIAAMLSKNPRLTPSEMKSMLLFSCKSLNLLKLQQGYGMPDLNSIIEH